MLCVLAFVGAGHIFINGSGSWFYRSCRYDCGDKAVTIWIDFSDACPKEWGEA